MSTLLTTRPVVREPFRVAATHQERLFGEDVRPATVVEPREAPVRDEPPAPAAVTSGPTLDAAISSAWKVVAAGQTAACPVCAAPMEAGRSAGATAARCTSCGSTLS